MGQRSNDEPDRRSVEDQGPGKHDDDRSLIASRWIGLVSADGRWRWDGQRWQPNGGEDGTSNPRRRRASRKPEVTQTDLDRWLEGSWADEAEPKGEASAPASDAEPDPLDSTESAAPPGRDEPAADLRPSQARRTGPEDPAPVEPAGGQPTPDDTGSPPGPEATSGEARLKRPADRQPSQDEGGSPPGPGATAGEARLKRPADRQPGPGDSASPPGPEAAPVEVRLKKPADRQAGPDDSASPPGPEATPAEVRLKKPADRRPSQDEGDSPSTPEADSGSPPGPEAAAREGPPEVDTGQSSQADGDPAPAREAAAGEAPLTPTGRQPGADGGESQGLPEAAAGEPPFTSADRPPEAAPAEPPLTAADGQPGPDGLPAGDSHLEPAASGSPTADTGDGTQPDADGRPSSPDGVPGRETPSSSRFGPLAPRPALQTYAAEDTPMTAAAITTDRLLRPPEPGQGARGFRAVLQRLRSRPRSRPAEEEKQRQLMALCKTRVPGCRRIAVISRKGGIGKTTTALMLGHQFASLRDDRVLALDANPDAGSLGDRVPSETRCTVTDILRDADRLLDYADVRALTSQAQSGLEVVASDNDPRITEALGEEDYRQVLNVLAGHYSVLVCDTGTGILDSATRGLLNQADQIVLCATQSVDASRVSALTLDWMDQNGYQHLVRDAVVTINAVHTGLADIDRLQTYFERRCRAVVRIPWDMRLALGAETTLDELQPGTQAAYLNLAAMVAAGFAR